jgi:hypothetical protein
VSDPYRSVSPGERLSIPAVTWNRLVRMARAAPPGGRGPDSTSPVYPSHTVLVQNSTGSSVSSRSVLAVSDPVTSPEGQPLAFLRRPVLVGTVPVATTDVFAVLSEPASAGDLARGVVGGLAVVAVDFTSAGHQFATPKVGSTSELVSAASGPARVVWRAGSGTGVDITVVLIGQAGGGEPSLYLVEVVALGLGGNHTVKRKTYSIGGEMIWDYSPVQLWSNVRSTTGTGLPIGTLGYLNPIPDVAGNYWISPHAEYATATEPGLLSHTDQTIGGRKYFRERVVLGNPATQPLTIIHAAPFDFPGTRFTFGVSTGETPLASWSFSARAGQIRYLYLGDGTAYPYLAADAPVLTPPDTPGPLWVSVTTNSQNTATTPPQAGFGGYAVHDYSMDPPSGVTRRGLWGQYGSGYYGGGLLLAYTPFQSAHSATDVTTSGSSPTDLSTVTIPAGTLDATSNPETAASGIDVEYTVEVAASSTADIEVTLGGEPVLTMAGISTGGSAGGGVITTKVYRTGADSVRAVGVFTTQGISGGARFAVTDAGGLDFGDDLDLIVTATASSGSVTLRTADVRARPAAGGGPISDPGSD